MKEIQSPSSFSLTLLSELDSSFSSSEQTPPHDHTITGLPLIISHSLIASLKTLTPQISCLAVQNHTLYAATIQQVYAFELTNFSFVDAFGSRLSPVKSITFHALRIFTAHQDCKIRVWQKVMQKHQLISTLPTLRDRFLNSMFATNYIQVRRHTKKLWVQHSDAVSDLAVSSGDGLLYSASWDGSFKVWKVLSNMECLESVRAHPDAINAVAISTVNRIIYTGSSDGQVKAWKLTGGRHELLTTVERHKSSVNALALTGNGSRIFSGGADWVIHVWQWGDCGNTLIVDCSLQGHKGPVLCMVSVKGLLISGSSDRTVRIWGFGNKGCCLAVLAGHSRPVKSLYGIPGQQLGSCDCLTVFSGGLDGEIRAWKVVICFPDVSCD